MNRFLCAPSILLIGFGWQHKSLFGATQGMLKVQHGKMSIIFDNISPLQQYHNGKQY